MAQVSVTGGEEIAKQTTNARLGVLGGDFHPWQHRGGTAVFHCGVEGQRAPGC